MISIYSSLLQSLAIIVGLILASLLLRRKSIISEEQRPVFGRLVTDFALPALIFSGLARQSFERGELVAVGIMAAALLICMILGWLAGRALGLSAGQLGAFILVAAFGSSSTLGYALISQAFPDDPAMLAEAVVISELGVGILIFTVGVAVAISFGQGAGGSLTSGLRTFLRSPIFISLVLGLAFSFLEPSPTNPVLKTALDLIFRMLDVIGGSLVIFVALAIALMLKPIPARKLAGLIVAVALIKLIAKPLIAFSMAEAELLPMTVTEILLIEAAMPSGTVAAVLADRYGCDGSIASALVIATYGLSLLTIPLIMLLTI
ncbi:AEC family transporter [Methanocrinis sp.]|uniref:AEC family transporter n=1 Tax=Methanocrinis sp. TaxID=3101522 RepID=UPI003D0B572B